MFEINHSIMQSKPTLVDEADEQIIHPKLIENAYQKALEHMIQKDAYGSQKRVGRYVVGFAVEPTDSSKNYQHGHLLGEQPGNENLHIEITIQDRTDGHFIPGLNVFATLIDQHGKEIGTHKQPFLWHPWLFHYGRNWKVPSDGRYTLKVHAEAPEFMKRDPLTGKRILKPIEVEFTGLCLK